MPEPTDLSELIEAEAQLPRRSSNDGQEAEGRSLTELVEAAKYLDAKGPANPTRRSAWGAVKMARAVPPGAT